MTERIGVTDHLIERAQQDLLGRSRYAELLALETQWKNRPVRAQGPLE